MTGQGASPHLYTAPPVGAAGPGFTPDAREQYRISRAYRHVPRSDGDYDASVVKSAHRVLLVFEFFAEYRRPASAIEIAVTLDIPQSSTSMLLRSLVSVGYLSFDPVARLYAPTLRLSLIGAWQQDQAMVASELVGLVDALHAETGECVLLAEAYRNFTRVIHVRQSEDPDKLFYMPLGTLRPICSSAFGQVLLAQMPESEAGLLIRRALADRDSADYGLEVGGVLQAMARARAQGFACTSRVVDDLHTFQIATLLPPRAGEPPMAVGIVSYGARFLERERALIETLMAGVASVGAAAG